MNKYGVIGRTLKHSFSKEIHERLFSMTYDLIELEPDRLKEFITGRKFRGVNVTIPYKQDVIPMLDFVDVHASQINAVNTIVNDNGKLYGYNTDYLGLSELIKVNGIEIENKNVLLLGNGGTSNTARYVLKRMNSGTVTVVSRNGESGTITYAEALKKSETEIIVNTTPVGMYPNNDGRIIDISVFPKLEAVVDVVYNPLRTMLCIDAGRRGLKYCGGLYMLVSQAVYASEYFQGKKIDKAKTKAIFSEIKSRRENIVLIGMPTSGKTTISNILKAKSGRPVYDTDEEISKLSGSSPEEFIRKNGIEKFRSYESAVIKELSKKQGVIISTGGGAVLNKTNVDYLSQNGVIVFIDRPLELLQASSTRPLSSTREDLEKRYKERYEIYKKAADIVINNNKSIDEAADSIMKEFRRHEENTYR